MPPKKDPRSLLHLGCGPVHFSGWVNADYYRFSDLFRRNRIRPDWMLDAGRPWRCDSNFWDGIHTEHTLEHLDYNAVICALKEAHRTLKFGKWIRIVVPGLSPVLSDRTHRYQAEAIAHLTQTHGHLSVWDTDLLCDLLKEIGFSTVLTSKYANGQDPTLVMDLADRAAGSIYVEAQK